jgi:flagellar biosynthetic protein FliR
VAELPLVGLVFARCGGLLALAPPLNIKQFPVSLRLGIAGVIAIALAPIAQVHQARTYLPLEYTALLLREVGIGLLMGFAAALVFWAFVIAGQLLDSYLGAGEASARQQGQGPLATLLYLVAAAAFVAADAHHWVLAALAQGLQALPLGAGVFSLSGAGGLVRGMLGVGVAVAAPTLAVIYAAEVTLASFDRCAPALNLGALHQPVRWSAGLLALAVSLPLLSRVVMTQGQRVIESVGVISQALGGG